MQRGWIEQIYVTYGPMVLRRARLILRNEAAAHDALHDVFVRVMGAAREFRAQASPATWLYRITTNHCLNVLRNERRRSELWEQNLASGAENSVDPDAEARVQVGQVLRFVRPELQEIALYHLVDEMNHDEIAALVGVSRRTIGNRLDEFRTQVAAAASREAS